jgi:hypothetical protein
LQVNEPISKCSILSKVKEGKNFNHMNTRSILRINPPKFGGGLKFEPDAKVGKRWRFETGSYKVGKILGRFKFFKRRKDMKKFLVFVCAMMLVLGTIGMARAAMMDFDVAGSPDSSVTLSNVGIWYGWASISADLVSGLGSTFFSLNDGESETFDFFSIEVGSPGGAGSADIEATLAFDSFDSEITSSGSGGSATFFGRVFGNSLTWDTMPQTYVLGNGNSFDVDFEDILQVGSENSTIIQATVTAHVAPVPEPATILLMSGTDTANVAPVPEPATILLMSGGLLGLVVNRKRFTKKS